MPQSRSSAYQRYLNDINSLSNYLIGLCAGRGALERIQRNQSFKYFQALINIDSASSTKSVTITFKPHSVTPESLLGDETFTTVPVAPYSGQGVSNPNYSTAYERFEATNRDSVATFGSSPAPALSSSVITIGEKRHRAYLRELKAKREAKNAKLRKEREERQGAKKEDLRGCRLGPKKGKEAPMMKREGKHRGP